MHRESTQAAELKDKHESIQEAELKVLNKQDVVLKVHDEPTQAAELKDKHRLHAGGGANGSERVRAGCRTEVR